MAGLHARNVRQEGGAGTSQQGGSTLLLLGDTGVALLHEKHCKWPVWLHSAFLCYIKQGLRRTTVNGTRAALVGGRVRTAA